MWPFSKKPTQIAPPVDLDTPVTNPKLVEAIDSFAKSKNKRQLENLLTELRRSVYLVVAHMDDATVRQKPGSDQATIEKGSTIGIVEVDGPDGGRALPLFSDWDAIRKFTQDEVSTLVMPADQAWRFAAEKYDAAVVNPGGPALPLQSEQILDLASTSVAP